MRFALAVAIAIHFWAVRGVEVPCQPVARPGADALMPIDPQLPRSYNEPVWMAVGPGPCEILLSNGGSVQRVWNPEWYCGAVAHEVGHLAGLGHTETGIMRDPLEWWADLPYDCVHWQHFARQHEFSARPAVRVANS